VGMLTSDRLAALEAQVVNLHSEQFVSMMSNLFRAFDLAQHSHPVAVRERSAILLARFVRQLESNETCRAVVRNPESLLLVWTIFLRMGEIPANELEFLSEYVHIAAENVVAYGAGHPRYLAEARLVSRTVRFLERLATFAEYSNSDNRYQIHLSRANSQLDEQTREEQTLVSEVARAAPILRISENRLYFADNNVRCYLAGWGTAVDLRSSRLTVGQALSIGDTSTARTLEYAIGIVGRFFMNVAHASALIHDVLVGRSTLLYDNVTIAGRAAVLVSVNLIDTKTLSIILGAFAGIRLRTSSHLTRVASLIEVIREQLTSRLA
jgi:hypothetical protein